jgi:predicted RNA-binding protein Jag
MSEKAAQVEAFLGDVLSRMEFRARLEVKELEDQPASDAQPAIPGSLSVAIFPEGELHGLSAGKRTPVVEALQFLANKAVNRGPEKKWVNVGVGGHPPVRVPGQKKPRAEAAPRPPAPAQGEATEERKKERSRGERAERGAKPERAARPERAPRAGGRDVDEAALEVPDDPAVTAVARALAQKAAELGRTYAVICAGPEDRARMLKAVGEVDYVRGKVEGEGRHRRVVLLPANPRPMPKKTHMPDYDEEDDLEE